MHPHILLIGNLTKSQGDLTKLATDATIKSVSAPSLETGLLALENKPIDMIFASSEIDLPVLFSHLNSNKVVTPVVVLGPPTPVQNAVKAIRLGAIEYLSEPLDKKAVSNLINKIKPLKTDTNAPIAGDPKTHELLEMAKRFAAANATVLLRGESGTGKEVFSRYIHHHSPRSENTFVGLNCAAVPESLLESELFGHLKGSFSGAMVDRLGKFQLADQGTLLLDEISEMDVSLQTKLLRAIQERVVDQIGSTEPTPVDIRLIATTNRNLEKEVEEGRFREDLYFRLNVISLEIPALRERPGDILPLSMHFARKYAEQNGIEEVINITPEAENKLLTCYWKGNVRELENTIHRAVLMMGTQTEIRPEHIVISTMSQNAMSNIGEGIAVAPEQAAIERTRAATGAAAGAYANTAGGFSSGIHTPTPGNFAPRPLQEAEKDLILSTLNYCQGNRTHAADILGISIRTLRNKLKEYQEAG